MHWFVTDETNNDFVAGAFFIYGGLVVTDAQLQEIHTAVEAIRTKYGYLPGDSLKFHTRSRPAQVSVADSKAAKQAVVEALERIGARLIVYVILHDIAQHQSADTRQKWALNTVTYAYYRLLAEENAGGVFLMDRDDDQHTHLASLFQSGPQMSDGRYVSVSDRIFLFGMTANNASHLSSAVDIALGGFRYCVNAAGGSGTEIVASEIFPPLTRMLWGKEVGGTKYIRDRGFHPMPKTEIRSYAYKQIYKNLYAKLNEYSGDDSDTPEEAQN